MTLYMQHFIWLSAHIKAQMTAHAGSKAVEDALIVLANAIADDLQRGNPRFKRVKFLAAAGVQE
jgi:hypothetical protein